MNKIPEKIKITDDLILKIAREKFNTYYEEIFDDEREYIKIDWINKAYDMIDNFNDLIDILKKINYQTP
jgi:hypothetical protein